jgi:dipeptidyl aminopeptidase/acylaminoacyl peptidase
MASSPSSPRAFSGERRAQPAARRPIPIDAPVRILHGQVDADVPWRNSLTLAQRLRSADVQTIFVKDGDHRLSRPQDITLLIATVSALKEQA